MKVDVKYILFAATLSMGLFTSCTSSEEECKLPQSCHGLNMTELPQRWDEAIPLGNGLTGGLLWQKDGKLRLAIDRADLWDLRPVEAFKSPDHTYRFICDQVIHKKDMRPVYALIDDRTANDPAPTKIPAGALEFDIHKFLLCFFIICIRRKFPDLGKVCDPAFSHMRCYPVSQKRVRMC